MPYTRSRLLLLGVLVAAAGFVPVGGSWADTSVTLAPDADARVESANPGRNFGSSSTLVADGSPVTSSYLRFVVPSSVNEVTRARLRLYVTDPSGGGAVLFPTNTNWTETGLTYQSRPTRTGPEAARTGAVTSGRWVDLDITTLVTGPGTVSLELAGASGDGVDFKSRNSTSNRPELVIDTGTPPPPPPPPAGSVTLTPDADARVESANPARNFGSSSTLVADGSPVTSSYLRFVVPSSVNDVTRARLRLYVTDSSGGGAVLFPTSSDWTESGVTYQSRPARTGPEATRTGAVTSGRWVELDVTSLVTGPGTVSLELAGASGDGVDFKSRNSTSNRPELVVDTGTPPPPPPPPPPGSQPNFVVFLTDDQRGADTLGVMPKTMQWFADGGTVFPNGVATTPLCCPSRSGVFSGRYTHNHGNLNNQTTDNLDYDATFQAYLKAAGYQTGIVGKFLLDWNKSTPPPYFDYWAVTSGGYENVTFGTDQGSLTAAYTTTETGRQALRMLDAFEADDSRPFVLYVATQAPHSSWEPEPAYESADVGPWEGNPSIFESDRSDKPSWVRSSSKSFNEGAGIRRQQLRTLKSVDDMVDRVMTRLDALGEGANTVSIFTSDNGYQWGEHGLTSKYHPYNQSVSVPFMVRWPGRVPAGFVDRRYVGNVDITPSMLSAAAVTPALRHPLDGRPFLDPAGLSAERREEGYLEYFRDEHRSIPDWSSIRTEDFQYVEYRDGNNVVFREYYDMRADPFQLVNLLADGNPGNDPPTAALAERLSVYRRCSGTTGPTACA
ncbi:MAG: DNRLRE domain-containing protein [Actinomycetota bacterium]